MKKLFFVCVISLLVSCAGNTSTSTDPANAIDNAQLDTGTSSPQPNGYAPPNTKIDTSQARKDSIRARH